MTDRQLQPTGDGRLACKLSHQFHACVCVCVSVRVCGLESRRERLTEEITRRQSFVLGNGNLSRVRTHLRIGSLDVLGADRLWCVSALRRVVAGRGTEPLVLNKTTV